MSFSILEKTCIRANFSLRHETCSRALSLVLDIQTGNQSDQIPIKLGKASSIADIQFEHRCHDWPSSLVESADEPIQKTKGRARGWL